MTFDKQLLVVHLNHLIEMTNKCCVHSTNEVGVCPPLPHTPKGHLSNACMVSRREYLRAAREAPARAHVHAGLPLDIRVVVGQLGEYLVILVIFVDDELVRVGVAAATHRSVHAVAAAVLFRLVAGVVFFLVGFVCLEFLLRE